MLTYRYLLVYIKTTGFVKRQARFHHLFSVILRERIQGFQGKLAARWEGMSELRAVIFDLDGVLTDTAEFHHRAWQKLTDEEGLSFSREVNEKLRGVSRRESLLRILGERQVDEATLEAWMTRKNGYDQEMLRQVSPADLLPGVGTAVFPLVQPRAPSFGAVPDDAGDDPCRARRGGVAAAAQDIVCRLCGSPGTFRTGAAAAGKAAGRWLHK